MKLHKYNDPSHGWLKVKRSLLIELGIDKDISRCSYQRGQYVYLEEDRDLDLFCKAMKDAGRTFEVKSTSTEYKYSGIRSYDMYQYYTEAELKQMQELISNILNLSLWSKRAINKIKNGSLTDLKYWSDLYCGTNLY